MLPEPSAATATTLSIASFTLFAIVAAFDSTHYHFRRFRLWAHRETRHEHVAHTIRAMLMAPTMAFLFAEGRVATLAGAAFVALDFVAAGVDVAMERGSRQRFGGLPHGEYVAHLLATTLHVAALATAFFARALSDESLPLSSLARLVVDALVVGAALSAVQHLAYLCFGILRPSNTPAAATGSH
jgi:hypothetical protein